jgi:hypothetical protein
MNSLILTPTTSQRRCLPATEVEWKSVYHASGFFPDKQYAEHKTLGMCLKKLSPDCLR